jgi:hypothetical protein
MVHRLALVAITGIAFSAVCLGAGAAIEAQDGGRALNGMDFSWFGDRPRCETVAGATATSRDLEWDGSDHVGLAMHANATYTPGTDDRVHITGDPQLLAHVRIHNGSIGLDCQGGNFDRDTQITLPGREFRKFSIAGSGNMALRNLRQDKLKVAIAGSGDIKADGKVEKTEIHIAGSGNVDFGQVASRESKVHIAGSGDADIAPTDSVDIHIAGSGDVNLHSNPRNIDQHVAGSGRVHTVGSGG